MTVEVLFDIVSIKLICGDEYAAQVLYDDIAARFRAGQGITLTYTPKPKETSVSK